MALALRIPPCEHDRRSPKNFLRNGISPVCCISPSRIGLPNGRIRPTSNPIPARLLAYLAIISPLAKMLSRSSSLRISTQLLNCLVGVPKPANTGVASVKRPSECCIVIFFYVTHASRVGLFPVKHCSSGHHITNLRSFVDFFC